MSYTFKYADLLDDDVFKLVFGQESSKEVMIEFLNQVISDRKIVDLEFMDKEMHPLNRERKSSVYDMFCRTEDGSRIIVEVQRRKQACYVERAIYYSTFQIQRQIDAGNGDYNFYPIYVISILNFDLDINRGNPDVLTSYRLYEETSYNLLTDKVTFIFLELNKFKKTKYELSGDILEGMYFCFKNMAILTDRPEVLEYDVFRKIFEVSELLNMDEVTRLKVIEKMTTERDLRNQMEYARKIAVSEGHAEGLAEGLTEGKKLMASEIAAKLLASGMSLEQIKDLTGLDEEDISR